MAPANPLSTPPHVAPRPRVKVWFEAESGFGFGSGLIAILRAIEQAGSIKHAADALGQSYRHVWGRIQKAEQGLGLELVAKPLGGQGNRRCVLTTDAHRLIADFVALRARMVEVLEREFGAQSR